MSVIGPLRRPSLAEFAAELLPESDEVFLADPAGLAVGEAEAGPGFADKMIVDDRDGAGGERGRLLCGLGFGRD